MTGGQVQSSTPRREAAQICAPSTLAVAGFLIAFAWAALIAALAVWAALIAAIANAAP